MYRLSKAKLNEFHCDLAKTISFWFICVYAVTMTRFGGIFVIFSASSSLYCFLTSNERPPLANVTPPGRLLGNIRYVFCWIQLKFSFLST